MKEGDENIGKQKKLIIKQFRPARSIPPLTGAETFVRLLKVYKAKIVQDFRNLKK